MGGINSMPGADAVFNGLIFMGGIFVVLCIILAAITIYEKVSKKGDKDGH